MQQTRNEIFDLDEPLHSGIKGPHLLKMGYPSCVFIRFGFGALVRSGFRKEEGNLLKI